MSRAGPHVMRTLGGPVSFCCFWRCGITPGGAAWRGAADGHAPASWAVESPCDGREEGDCSGWQCKGVHPTRVRTRLLGHKRVVCFLSLVPCESTCVSAFEQRKTKKRAEEHCLLPSTCACLSLGHLFSCFPLTADRGAQLDPGVASHDGTNRWLFPSPACLHALVGTKSVI